MREPLLHSQITDGLPEDHALAQLSVCCVNCDVMVHGIANENMRAWMETGRGAWCLDCFYPAFQHSDIEEEAWALLNDDGQAE